MHARAEPSLLPLDLRGSLGLVHQIFSILATRFLADFREVAVAEDLPVKGFQQKVSGRSSGQYAKNYELHSPRGKYRTAMHTPTGSTTTASQRIRKAGKETRNRALIREGQRSQGNRGRLPRRRETGPQAVLPHRKGGVYRAALTAEWREWCGAARW